MGRNLAEQIFETSLWPVLDKAMTAGELLVARNTIPQKPVHEAIKVWLRGCLDVVGLIKSKEHTVSKAEALRTLYQLAVGAEHALEDAKRIQT